jgi:hypothetical protein
MTPADGAWAALAAGIIGWEVFAWLKLEDQLLTDAAHRYMERWPIVTAVAVGTTALHLTGVYKALNIKYLDPLHMTGKGVGKVASWLST